MEYLDFLKNKMVIAPEGGFEIDPAEVNPALKPHQRDAVVWAVHGGKRALFESFGLGKTVQELECIDGWNDIVAWVEEMRETHDVKDIYISRME